MHIQGWIFSTFFILIISKKNQIIYYIQIVLVEVYKYQC